MWDPIKFEVGDYVALLSNDFIIDDFHNPLGKINPDGSRNIGRVINKYENCVVVQRGGEKKTGIYDPIALGYIFVRIHPDTQNKTGSLGTNPNKVGVIVDWDNFATGNTISVRSGGVTVPTPYAPSDLIFEVSNVKKFTSNYFASQTGGAKRSTLRRNRIKRYLTRVMKRV